jgi:diguanylate cyclase (GGDEF)-like protein
MSRILVIDDNPAIHEDFRKVLCVRPDIDAQAALMEAEALLLGEPPASIERPAFDVDFAGQGREGFAFVQRGLAEGRPYGLAFVDMRMPPGWDGLETIEHLWAVDPHLQIVICSAHSDYDWLEVLRRVGHTDQLLVLRKPFEPIEVLQCAAALCRKWENERLMRGRVADLEQSAATSAAGLEAANSQLRHQATHDSVTGLPNRVLLDDRLEQAVVHADRAGHAFALMLCDLGRFKLINESLGHRAGDQLLQAAAQRLCSVVRPVDTVARITGDKFALVIGAASSTSDVESIARRAIDALIAPIEIAGISVHTAPNIGIALYPQDGGAEDTLFARADAALYSAKQRGHASVQCYAAGMNIGDPDKVRLESDLHRALALRQFELYYQPKVDTLTGAVHSAEALIRWHHPERGLVSPTEFIPLAEECGLIDAIGRWIAAEACRQTRAWQTSGMPALRIAINLSAAQFRAGDLVDTIRHALNSATLSARFLEVELTESALMSDPEKSIEILEQLSEMGVLISVDDFGTGYSSMSYLRRLPLDKLKIDRSFINEITARADDASIVTAIVSLAHSLRLKVVAEGVETADQLDFLKRLGCDQYQGYLFSRPLPAAEFERLMRSQQERRTAFMEDEALRTQSKLTARRRPV